MKKILFLVFGVLGMFLITTLGSCEGQKQKGSNTFEVEVSLDTTVFFQTPVTAPRWDCNGNLLPEPKLIGSEIREENIQLTRTVTINEDGQLISSGDYVYPVKVYSPDVQPNIWRMAENPILGVLYFLVLLTLVALLFLFFIWLIKQIIQMLNNDSNRSQAVPETKTVVQEITKEKPNSEPEQPEKSVEIKFYKNGKIKTLRIT